MDILLQFVDSGQRSAFSKFGSDLDAATMRVLDKGRKNVEILKQGQYSPMKIEHQIAIIYCGANELLRAVPIDHVKEFEADFLEVMEMQHRNTLDTLKEGQLTDEAEKTMRKVAMEVAAKYKH